jgi:hypothetical protein
LQPQQLIDGFKGVKLSDGNMPDFYIDFDNGGKPCRHALPGVAEQEWSTMKALTLEPGAPHRLTGTAELDSYDSWTGF